MGEVSGMRDTGCWIGWSKAAEWWLFVLVADLVVGLFTKLEDDEDDRDRFG
jgi:hypothetical protein